MNSLSWKSLIPLVIKKSLQIWSHMVGTNWYFPVLVQSRISTQTIVVLSVSLELKFLNHFHFFDNFWQLSIILYFLFSFRPLSFPLALSHNLSGMTNTTCTKRQYVDPYQYQTNPIAVGISTRLRFTKSVLGWLNFTYEYINNGPRTFEYLRNINSYLDFGQSHDWK